MRLSPRHWRARHLLGAWIAYWAALVAATLGPFALAVQRIKGAPKNTSGANFSLGDQGLQGAVTSHGQTLWSVHAGIGTVVLWLVVPPLLLWLLWMLLRPRPDVVSPAALGAGAPDWQARQTPAERDAARTAARRDR